MHPSVMTPMSGSETRLWRKIILGSLAARSMRGLFYVQAVRLAFQGLARNGSSRREATRIGQEVRSEEFNEPGQSDRPAFTAAACGARLRIRAGRRQSH